MLPLLLALALSGAPLPVTASFDASGAVVVSWPAVPGAARVCVVSLAGVPGCVEGDAVSWRQALAPRDVRLYLRAGEAVEVRAYGAEGELLASGRATVERLRVALPAVWN